MIDVATKANNIPYIRTSGSSANVFDLTTSFRMVLVAWAPNNIAPSNSYTAAMHKANLNVIDLAATGVAKALEQSFGSDTQLQELRRR